MHEGGCVKAWKKENISFNYFFTFSDFSSLFYYSLPAHLIYTFDSNSYFNFKGYRKQLRLSFYICVWLTIQIYPLFYIKNITLSWRNIIVKFIFLKKLIKLHLWKSTPTVIILQMCILFTFLEVERISSFRMIHFGPHIATRVLSVDN